jgi:hypothetical protein
MLDHDYPPYHLPIQTCAAEHPHFGRCTLAETHERDGVVDHFASGHRWTAHPCGDEYADD